MKLPETIEGLHVSAYFKSQTSSSFFLSATWSQSWVPSPKPQNAPHFWALFSFLLLHNSKHIYSINMKLSDTIEGLYVSAYFKSHTSISFFLLAMLLSNLCYKHRTAKSGTIWRYSHFYCSITQNILLLCTWNSQRPQNGCKSLHILNFRPQSPFSCQL